jgi:hypothetical protein
VSAPPFPTFAGISFPPNAGGVLSVGLNEVVALPNGSYADTFVNEGGTLVLSSGDYYFTSFTSNSKSVVRIADEGFRRIHEHRDACGSAVARSRAGTGFARG